MMDLHAKLDPEQQHTYHTVKNPSNVFQHTPRPKETLRRKNSTFALVLLMVSLGLWKAVSWTSVTPQKSLHSSTYYEGSNSEPCPQADPLVPQTNNKIWKTLTGLYTTDSYVEQAVEWLGGAVRIP